jgi:hypothetical protein
MNNRALCVGLNKFKNLPTTNWLNGCVNDAEDMAAMLTGLYGFAKADVTVLTDAQATKAAVMGELTKLVAQAKAGSIDRLFFSLSSHGTQVPDENGDEIDQMDEAFVVYDIAQKGDHWDPSTVIVDDEFHTLFGGLPDTALVEVLLDTCHSGTGLRSLDLLPGRKPRFLPPPTADGLDQVEESDTRTLRELVKGSAASRKPVLMAACRSSQTAADAHFDGKYNGAFTYFLLKSLTKDRNRSRAALLTEVSTSLRQGRFGQRPQLEAPKGAKAGEFGAAW